jgi:hypothetical protein
MEIVESNEKFDTSGVEAFVAMLTTNGWAEGEVTNADIMLMGLSEKLIFSYPTEGTPIHIAGYVRLVDSDNSITLLRES